MANEAQRNRRRRRRQRVGRRPQRRNRRRQNNNNGGATGNTGSYSNANALLTSNYEFNIKGLSSKSAEHLYELHFKDVPDWVDHISKGAGEYRLLRATAVYSPLAGKEGDKLGVAPFFDISNQLTDKIDFVTSGRRIRNANNPFNETLTIPSDYTSVIYGLKPIGGLSIYYSGEPADFGIISVFVTYQVRGRKTLTVAVDAKPHDPNAGKP